MLWKLTVRSSIYSNPEPGKSSSDPIIPFLIHILISSSHVGRDADLSPLSSAEV
jgi:hypothetical protein